MTKETWKDAIVWYKGEKLDYTGYYMVSDYGRIKSVDRCTTYNMAGVSVTRKRTGRVLKQMDMNGYRYVNLTIDGVMKTFYIHLIVLSTFVGKRPDGMECCHYNDIRHDNKLKNLRWGTRKENVIDDYMRNNNGMKSGQTTTKEQIAKIKKLLCESIKPSIIAHIIGVKNNIVGQIRRGECGCYRDVPWPNITKNFWESPGYISLGLKSSGKSKLSKDDIIEIKELIYLGRPKLATIARMYCVNSSHISKIKSGERYRNVGRKNL